MSLDEKKQEKMDVLYAIAELECEIGCLESRLLGASAVYRDLAEHLSARAKTSPETDLLDRSRPDGAGWHLPPAPHGVNSSPRTATPRVEATWSP